ncbi:chromosomal replication initiator DnaA [Roseomonas sp. NAR14]|uniref:Chromosomal replication initiator DnaA n=1 Tax=Roseomonas acroporae TaxID=2937791 RepID=A0A9X1Y4C3_9PROT|nr:chromosomal replication initiator DnaA [Roseomonas acroporae]MCK8782978.1 chromosomal replication initiator DnaA [Roseomonas acroporae]
MNAAPRQLALALPQAASYARADLVADASNAAALRWADRPEGWPAGRLAVWGPAGVGKTHLLRAIAAERGWRLIEGPFLRGLPEPAPGGGGSRGTVVDDADCAAEERALLHLVNLAAERGESLLLAGRAAPARWEVALPDLASRLRATAAVAIGPPGEALLRALLAKQFSERQLRVAPGLREWLLARLPREAAAVAEAAARLDRAALARGVPVTRALARAALAEWEGFGGTEEAGAAEEEARLL